jgi:hypothetical protein
MLLERGIRGEGIEPVQFDLPPRRTQGTAIHSDQHGHVALRSLHDFADDVAPFITAVQIEPFRLVGGLLGKVIRDGAANECRRIGSRHGECLTAAHCARKNKRQPQPEKGRLSG